jgi:hypothetical protein
MSKVISLKEIKYIKQYKSFYSNPIHRQMSTSVFFKSDVTYKKTKCCV